MTNQLFPKDFLWGAATASYQIEGAAAEDGRGPSIWDTYSATPGKTANGDTGAVACDHYHRVPEDIGLMKALGIKAYRFSISWSRVLPSGRRDERVNELGLAFYDNLVDTLLAAGIIPFATLYHWDLPQGLQDMGGWQNRAIVDHYVHYVELMVRTLGDRVKHWMTFNEPLCIAYISHVWGEHAPGHRDLSFGEANRVNHHVFLAHGKAVPVIRAHSPGAQVGIVFNMSPVHAASQSDADLAAVQRADDELNRWFADSIFKGYYPERRLAILGEAQPPVQTGDMAIISTPIDFLGINYYFRALVKDDPNSPMPGKYASVIPAEAELTEMGWEVYADGLRELLVQMQNDYQPAAIYVTESGCAMPDQLIEGQVQDPRRVAYLRNHFAAAQQAIAEGARLRGYFVWSLMDNFEWAYGYAKRFGLIYVDYATLTRHPKQSYAFYQKVIAENALPA
jgi:beta-glucosidase